MLVVVGGTIPGDDVVELKRLGVAEVFTPGAPTGDIVDFLRAGSPPSAHRGLREGGAGRRVRRAHRPATMRLDRSGDLALSEYDAHALEEALRLRESTGDGEVGILSMGPAKAMDALRKGLAMGADRAVLVSDDALAGADLVATSKALAAALAAWEPDLVLFGQQSADGNGACLWAAVAERLGLPVVSQAAELTIADGALTRGGRPSSATRRCARRCPRSSPSRTRSTSRATRRSRGSWARSRSRRRRSTQPRSAPTAASATSVLALQPPPPRGESLRIEGGADTAAAIVDFLAERRLL